MLKLRKLILLVAEIFIYYFAIKTLGKIIDDISPLDDMIPLIRIIYEVLSFVIALGLFFTCLVVYSIPERLNHLPLLRLLDRKKCLVVAMFLCMQQTLFLIWTSLLALGVIQVIDSSADSIPYIMVFKVFGAILWIAFSGYLSNKFSESIIKRSVKYDMKY